MANVDIVYASVCSVCVCTVHVERVALLCFLAFSLDLISHTEYFAGGQMYFASFHVTAVFALI